MLFYTQYTEMLINDFSLKALLAFLVQTLFDLQGINETWTG
jgi:hypothetical protein